MNILCTYAYVHACICVHARIQILSDALVVTLHNQIPLTVHQGQKVKNKNRRSGYCCMYSSVCLDVSVFMAVALCLVCRRSIETVRENIVQAMNHWHSHTCIQFVKRTNQQNFLLLESGPCG